MQMRVDSVMNAWFCVICHRRCKMWTAPTESCSIWAIKYKIRSYLPFLKLKPVVAYRTPHIVCHYTCNYRPQQIKPTKCLMSKWSIIWRIRIDKQLNSIQTNSLYYIVRLSIIECDRFRCLWIIIIINSQVNCVWCNVQINIMLTVDN